jgi:hypothetical protein
MDRAGIKGKASMILLETHGTYMTMSVLQHVTSQLCRVTRAIWKTVELQNVSSLCGTQNGVGVRDGR